MEKKPLARLSDVEGKIKLDKYDKRIIHELSHDSRQPLSKIAKKIKLGRDSVEYRVDRLEKKGVIEGFVPIINLSYFGYETFHVFFIINDANDGRKKLLLEKLISHQNTKSLMEYTDKWDLEWVLISRTIHEFDEILTEITTEFHDVIIQKNKLEIIKGYKSVHLPEAFYSKQKNQNMIGVNKINASEKSKYDLLDIKIIQILASNSRESSYKIAEVVGISANAVRNRIKRMLDQNIIWQFSIVVNLTLLKLHWYSLNVEVKTLNKNDEIRFKEFVNQDPFIIRAVKVLGSWDLIVYLISETLKDFHITTKKLQEEFVHQIFNYETLIAYKERIFTVFPEAVRKNAISNVR